MSNYYSRARPLVYEDERKEGLVFLDDSIGGRLSPDRILDRKAEKLCKVEGISYRKLEPIQRLFLTHYRCPSCKLMPLHRLDLTYPKRARCSRCGHLVSFTNAGKYGRFRKKLAFQLSLPKEEQSNVP